MSDELTPQKMQDVFKALFDMPPTPPVMIVSRRTEETIRRFCRLHDALKRAKTRRQRKHIKALMRAGE